MLGSALTDSGSADFTRGLCARHRPLELSGAPLFGVHEDGGRWCLVDQSRHGRGVWQAVGFDTHSVFADPLFVDPESNDYRVRSESPALKLGFQNFPMGTWRLTEEFPDVWRY